jgi:hypothetical protein
MEVGIFRRSLSILNENSSFADECW